jgi:hypothetical protein
MDTVSGMEALVNRQVAADRHRGEKKEEERVLEYRKVLNEFLVPFLKHPAAEGALLVGSYAVGLEDSFSDIDVCIIVSDSVQEWKRGNVMRSGFLIEYSIYPISYLRKLQDQDLVNRKRLRTRMLATGRVLFDKNGTIKTLQNEARKEILENLPPVADVDLEIRKYYLWDQLDNLYSLQKEKSPGFIYAYFIALQEVIEKYAAYLRLELPRPGRMHRFLTDAEFCKRYMIPQIPDPEFRELFELAMREPLIEKLERITRLVHDRMGGFVIDGWTVGQQVEGKPPKP